jgi:hypothetical protein
MNDFIEFLKEDNENKNKIIIELGEKSSRSINDKVEFNK